MPLAPSTSLLAIPGLLAATVAAYNMSGSRTARYNIPYANYIATRNGGIAVSGSLSAWIASGCAAPAIMALLKKFGMDRQGSRLVKVGGVQSALAALPAKSMDWVAAFRIPLPFTPALIVPVTGGPSLAEEIVRIYNQCATPGSISVSGGIVVASKTMHCLFPDLAPMIDGRHTGISYYNVTRPTYLPPMTYSWDAWIGTTFVGAPNPSPRGAGWRNWGPHQFLATLGLNQHIYELWTAGHPGLGVPEFLALDGSLGTTGIPRVIDKALW
jgi:hypothetical protein